MSPGIIIGIVCALGAYVLLVKLLHDLIVWVYQEGRERGRTDTEKAFLGYEKGADEARQQIWRDEARK